MTAPCDLCQLPLADEDERLWGGLRVCRTCDDDLTAEYVMEQAELYGVRD